MKKILCIAPFYPPDKGGAEAFAKEITDHYCEKGFWVELICFNSLNGNQDQIEAANNNEHYSNKKIHRIKWFGKNLFDTLAIKYLVILYIFPAIFFSSLKYLIKFKTSIDVIDCHGLLATSCGFILNKIFKVNYVSHVLAIYNFKDPIMKYFFKLFLNNANKVFIEKGLSKSNLEKLGINTKLLIEYNQPVNFDKFYPLKKDIKEKHKSRLNITFDKNFVFVGRGISIKGQEFYMELCNKLPNYGFIMITNKIELDLYHKIINFKNKSKNFFLFEDIPYKDLNIYYQISDVICIPSKYDENSVRVLGEAISSGLSVISSDRGSLPYIVKNSFGYSIPLEIDLFINKINLLMNNSQQLKKFTDSSYYYSRKNYSYKNFDKILLNLFS